MHKNPGRNLPKDPKSLPISIMLIQLQHREWLGQGMKINTSRILLTEFY